MSQTLSLRVPDQMMERLESLVRHRGNGMTRTKFSVLLLEESLREFEFPLIEFRDSATGRQPFLRSSGLAVWEMILIARSYQFNAAQLAQDYHLSQSSVQAAFDYLEAYRDEIDRAIQDNQIGYEALKRSLPGATLFTVPSEIVAEESGA